jgi:hypothetical protein
LSQLAQQTLISTWDIPDFMPRDAAIVNLTGVFNTQSDDKDEEEEDSGRQMQGETQEQDPD